MSKKDLIKSPKNVAHPNSISVGVTWVDGRILLDPEKDKSQKYFAVCHYSNKIWAITPLDWTKATLITTIAVSPSEGYCEKAHVCLDFKCSLNKFKKDMYLDFFKDVGALTLGLPNNMGKRDLWFNEGQWGVMWARLLMTSGMYPEGGTLKFDENKKNSNLIIT